MITKLKELFGMKESPDYDQLIKDGAVIVDVRSKSEFASGHIKSSRNIPLSDLNSKAGSLKDKNKPIITCCASGMRSASAKKLLRSKGYTNVYNGGGWARLNNKIGS